jgi:hypothetical protein
MRTLSPSVEDIISDEQLPGDKQRGQAQLGRAVEAITYLQCCVVVTLAIELLKTFSGLSRTSAAEDFNLGVIVFGDSNRLAQP